MNAALSLSDSPPALWLAVAGACVGLAALLPLFTAVSGLVFPRRLVVGVGAFSAVALLFGELGQGYETVPWLDLALHVVSMAVLAVVGMGLALLPTAGGPVRTPVWVLSTLAFGFAMMVGALWEVMEFALDGLLGTNTQDTGLPDTMWDIVANALGAALGAVAAHAAACFGRRVPPAGLLLDVVAANPVIYGAWRGPLGGAQREVGGAQARADGPLQRGGQARPDVVPGE